jgi:hypothetical protein
LWCFSLPVLAQGNAAFPRFRVTAGGYDPNFATDVRVEPNGTPISLERDLALEQKKRTNDFAVRWRRRLQLLQHRWHDDRPERPAGRRRSRPLVLNFGSDASCGADFNPDYSRGVKENSGPCVACRVFLSCSRQKNAREGATRYMTKCNAQYELWNIGRRRVVVSM